jgi:predicted O-linked N-acetylglucosamine transferase (SPINDLY family)
MPDLKHSDTTDDMFGPRLANALGEHEILYRAGVESHISALQARLHSGTSNPNVYLELAGHYGSLGNHDAALETLASAARRFPHRGEVHYALLRRLHWCGLNEQALAAGEQACRLVPDDFAVRLEYHLYLPQLYDSAHDILKWHARFARGLEKCAAECDLRTVAGAINAARGLAHFAPFHLAYQGFDDLSLLRRYGEFAHSVMSAAYPAWSKLSFRTPSRKRAKLRVGYVSAYFRRHTVGQHFLGWLVRRNHQLYDAHCYYVGEPQDSVTQQYRCASDVFFQSRDLKRTCSAILRDQPDVLVFTDVGMDPVTSQMAAVRLAPVQCVAYGHPITTGLPSVDYFLSGDSIEPPNAQEHYTEKLIRLPNLGISYAKPAIPRALLSKKRSDFGLPDDAVVYLCCQSLFKFLPQYDHLFADIARAVPNACLVFIAPNGRLGSAFQERLDRSFHAAGLRATVFCRFLDEQSILDYWNLHFLSDVFLDPIGWSGSRTTFDAITCQLPVVTLPGHCMRQRQSAAMLGLLGVEETIADSEGKYVDLAVRLGNDLALKRIVRTKTRAAHHLLFSDDSSVCALEEFFSRAFSEIEAY